MGTASSVELNSFYEIEKSKPLDASDISTLEAGKAEITRIR